ncbi:MAG: hypothetical protein M1819_003203 [Sarea resinae]|nr:MAG: hypothetical protein M1819_003203 [Sarea resinae]
MTTNITNTPNIDPLPIYSRDPDRSSILSDAPSYSSEAPSYHSSSTHNHHHPPPSYHHHHRHRNIDANNNNNDEINNSPPRQPNPYYAPGFRPPLHRHNNSIASAVEQPGFNFNISQWSSPHSSHQARHYQNVAHRRANVLAEAERIVRDAAVPSVVVAPLNTVTTPPTSVAPASPHEDPDLVGHEAAERTRMRRLYMQKCADEEALRQEGKAWDFLLQQMADWGERDRSWKKFRNDVVGSRVFGRKVGLRNWKDL